MILAMLVFHPWSGFGWGGVEWNKVGWGGGTGGVYAFKFFVCVMVLVRNSGTFPFLFVGTKHCLTPFLQIESCE